MENITEVEAAHPFHAGVTATARQAPRESPSGRATSSTGRSHIEGDLHIEGTADGEITASGDVDVEASATVRARIDGRNVTVRGNVTGNVVAHARLTVAGSGVVLGDVRASTASRRRRRHRQRQHHHGCDRVGVVYPA